MHLGATELFHSVTPTGSAIYTHGQNFGNFSETSSPAHSSLCLQGLWIVLLVAIRLLSLVSVAVNGNQPRRCRRSEFIAELGYELDHCAIPI